MPSVIVRQTVDLYGTRYKVGLRDIPEGHQCGHEWDGAVAAGYVEPVAKVSQKAAEVVESVVEAVQVVSDSVAALAEVIDACDGVADQPVVEKPSRKNRG